MARGVSITLQAASQPYGPYNRGLSRAAAVIAPEFHDVAGSGGSSSSRSRSNISGSGSRSGGGRVLVVVAVAAAAAVAAVGVGVGVGVVVVVVFVVIVVVVCADHNHPDSGSEASTPPKGAVGIVPVRTRVKEVDDSEQGICTCVCSSDSIALQVRAPAKRSSTGSLIKASRKCGLASETSRVDAGKLVCRGCS